MADNWNKLKNMASKAIGEKMKVRGRFLHNCCISQRKYGTMSKYLRRFSKMIDLNKDK